MRWDDVINGPKVYAALGLGGASSTYVSAALSRCFVIVMLILSLLLLLQWQLLIKGNISQLDNYYANLIIWLAFLINFIIPLSIIRHKSRYMRDNWVSILILLVGLPLLWPSYSSDNLMLILRPMLAIYILLPSLSMLLSFFIDGVLYTTLVASGIIVLIFGLLVAGIDPAVQSAADGIWWSLATITGVGYGDIVPVSVGGRVLGAVLMIIGIGVFVVMTANFLGIILSRKKKKHSHASDLELLTITAEIVATQAKHDAMLEQIMQDLQDIQKNKG